MRSNKQAGFLLLELLLTLPILVTLLALGCYLFACWGTTFTQLQAYYYLHENARLAHFLLRNDIKGIRYFAYHLPHHPETFNQNGHFYKLNQGLCFSLGESVKCFYVANTQRKNKQGQSIFSLYEKINHDAAQEIIENVEQFKIFYGVASTHEQGINHYTEDPMTYSAENIHVMQLFLLFTSNENVLKKPMTYHFANHALIATDKRLYQPLQLVINLA